MVDFCLLNRNVETHRRRCSVVADDFFTPYYVPANRDISMSFEKVDGNAMSRVSNYFRRGEGKENLLSVIVFFCEHTVYGVGSFDIRPTMEAIQRESMFQREVRTKSNLASGDGVWYAGTTKKLQTPMIGVGEVGPLKR